MGNGKKATFPTLTRYPWQASDGLRGSAAFVPRMNEKQTNIFVPYSNTECSLSLYPLITGIRVL